MKKYVFVSFLLVAVLVSAFQIAVAQDQDGGAERDSVAEVREVGDCYAFGSGGMAQDGSFKVDFSCSTDATVFFGVCDSGSARDDYFEVWFRDEKVSSNSFSGESESVDIGSASVVADENLDPELRSVAGGGSATYSYYYGSNRGNVANYLNQQCGHDFEVPPTPETIFKRDLEFAENGEIKSFVEDIPESEYPVIFLAEWGGSEYQFIPKKNDVPLDPNDDGVKQTTTDTSVEWEVKNAEPGDWEFEVEAIDVTPDPNTGTQKVTVSAYTLVAGGKGKRGAIQGMVFEDVNLNGIMDDGEIGIAGVTVLLETPGDVFEFYTGEDGIYHPVALGPSYYWVEVVVPEGWSPTMPTKTDAIPIKVDGGGNAIDVNFGLVRGGTGGPVVPGALPASGFGPGPDYSLFLWLGIGGLLLAGGTLTFAARKQRL